MIEVTTDVRAAVVRYEQASTLVASTLMRAMQDIGNRLTRSVIVDQLSGQTLHARTGNLKRSPRQQITAADRTAAVRVDFDPGRAPYGAIHETGGTIRPKRSRFLAIPLDAAKTGAGVSRFGAREVMANPQAFGYKHCFVAKGVIFGVMAGAVKDRRGMVGTVPLFALKSSVTLPERAPLRKTLDANRGWIDDRVGQAVHEATQSLGGA